MLKQIVDGFSYNPNLLYLPCRYWANALAQLDPLRRAKNYRPRWFVSPSGGQVISAYDTFFDQFQIPEGSILWGYNFNAISVEDEEILASYFMLQVRDSCTGEPLFRDYINGGGMTCPGNTRCYPIILSQMRPVVGSGKFDISLANLTSSNLSCQLLLHFAEPCAMVDEKTGKAITSTGGK